MDFDRQAIERRDFPIARRGYDTAAVDAHLRALAAEFEELARAGVGDAPVSLEPTLAATTSSQVQSILQAAETAAAELERQSRESSQQMREDAEHDAAVTREQAIAQARAHVTAVAQATSVLLERVSSMDVEVGGLVGSLSAGASMLAGDLAAVERNMGELYDAASGGARGEAAAVPPRTRVVGPQPGEAPAPYPPAPERVPVSESSEEPDVHAAAPVNGGQAEPAAPPAREDVDGARLIALNMALNGDSRADTDRYLAENFELADRQKLIDEVYAAIEG
ncbi:MAG TPA: DivIVA domain-containing protein [Solirubrobacteraceae bacterium]|nr:DivIVA domain-containing protein [Solirubrobacteraceae bacterium]